MNGQATLLEFDQSPDLSQLTQAERSAWEAIEEGDTGVREYQRLRGYSSPGTVSNLLRRARRKVDGGTD